MSVGYFNASKTFRIFIWKKIVLYSFIFCISDKMSNNRAHCKTFFQTSWLKDDKFKKWAIRFIRPPVPGPIIRPLALMLCWRDTNSVTLK